jgi:peptidoglycan/xylan/chitin deacetylase (PgdA/CDA1 family)
MTRASRRSKIPGARQRMTPPPYSAIVDRPPLAWPGGARVAVWPMLAIEHFVWGKSGTAIQPLLVEHPEVANWAWRDYGNRVGVWRLFDLFDELDVPLTVCLSAEACQHYPGIIEAIKDHPRWAVLLHGLNNNTAGHRGLPRRAERQLVERALEMTAKAFGKIPRGFMVPNWSMTEATFDILLEAGVRYTTDWMNDDQPYWYELRGGRLLNVPYNLETNDYTLVLTARLPGPEVSRAVVDHFDQLWRDGETHGRSMAIGIHSFISGQPLRARYVREYLEHMKATSHTWLTTSDAIYDRMAEPSAAP